MYWYCTFCSTWRADTYIKIDPRTLGPMCKQCGEWVRHSLSDGEYQTLWGQHAMEVPPPHMLNGHVASHRQQDDADEDTG